MPAPTAPPPRPHTASPAAPGRKAVLRALIGLALLAAVLALANPAQVLAQLAQASVGWLLAGLAVAVAASTASALRWRALARWLGADMSAPLACRWYFQGMGLNALLPGAVVGGDVFRAMRLHRHQAESADGHAAAGQDGHARAKATALPAAAGLSVALDRISGLWMLCVMGMAGAALCAPALAAALPPAWAGGHVGGHVGVHIGAGALAAACAACAALGLALPWGLAWALARRLPQGLSSEGASASTLAPFPQAASASRGARLGVWLGALRLACARADFKRQLAMQAAASLLVQGLSATALACGALALGVAQPAAVWAFAVMPVFLMAALPTSVGGWGSREAAAVAALAPFGVPAAAAVGIGMVYGLYGLAQGALGALAFGLPARAAPQPQ